MISITLISGCERQIAKILWDRGCDRSGYESKEFWRETFISGGGQRLSHTKHRTEDKTKRQIRLSKISANGKSQASKKLQNPSPSPTPTIPFHVSSVSNNPYLPPSFLLFVSTSSNQSIAYPHRSRQPSKMQSLLATSLLAGCVVQAVADTPKTTDVDAAAANFSSKTNNNNKNNKQDRHRLLQKFMKRKESTNNANVETDIGILANNNTPRRFLQ